MRSDPGCSGIATWQKKMLRATQVGGGLTGLGRLSGPEETFSRHPEHRGKAEKHPVQGAEFIWVP